MSSRGRGRLSLALTSYYSDDLVTLYHGDCREITEWLAADVLVTDPPYGRRWGQHGDYNKGLAHKGIAGDATPALRDEVLLAWGDRPAAVFGDLLVGAPRNSKQVLVYEKAAAAGVLGCVAGFRRDAEGVYLVGRWPQPPAARGSVLRTVIPNVVGVIRAGGHPHAKPVDIWRP